MKKVYIIRGVSGGGKSTLAEEIAKGYENGMVFEADQYFYDEDGNYNWSADKLHEAHMDCQKRFKKALADPDVDCLILSNTNTRVPEFSPYKTMAEDAGAMVFVLICENRHGGGNKHRVPPVVLEKQEQRIKSNIKLS